MPHVHALRFRRRVCALSFVLFGFASDHAWAQRHVTVSASATEEYLENRVDDRGDTVPQKYVFLEGSMRSGGIRDGSLAKTEIQAIAETLAPYLARKKFLPTADADDADIIIAVHWGMTVSLSRNTDYVAELMHQARDNQRAAQETFNSSYIDEEGKEIEPSDYAQALLQESAAQAAAAPDYEWARMASGRVEQEFHYQPTVNLLGFANVLKVDSDRAFMGEDARTVRAMLDEERYYVVLAAYDLKNRGADGSFTRLWVARLSTRAAGINFPTALEKMGEVGANFFGENNQGLTIERSPAKPTKADVDIGTPIVVDGDAP